MAGTLTISTLSDGTNSTSSTNCIQGSAKAWANFNATSSPAIRASYNFSSITRVSQGAYTFAFTNALSDINYSVVATSSGDQNGSTTAFPYPIQIFVNSSNTVTAPTTTGFGIRQSWNGSGLADPTYLCITVNR